MIDVRTSPAPIEVVSPIRPSEAIRLGCLVRPVQAFGTGGVGVAACALAALDTGSGGNMDTYKTFALLPMECPGCGHRDFGSYVVIHVNDIHRWTRERIADWLESRGL